MGNLRGSALAVTMVCSVLPPNDLTAPRNTSLTNVHAPLFSPTQLLSLSPRAAPGLNCSGSPSFHCRLNRYGSAESVNGKHLMFKGTYAQRFEPFGTNNWLRFQEWTDPPQHKPWLREAVIMVPQRTRPFMFNRRPSNFAPTSGLVAQRLRRCAQRDVRIFRLA